MITYDREGNIQTFERQQQPKLEDEQMPFPIILAVDPSMNSLGWAAHNFNLGENRYDIESGAWRFGVIHPRSLSEHPQHKWRDALKKLRTVLKDWKPTHFAVEYPTFFGSTRGKIAAMQGYTLNLAGMCGYLAGAFDLPSDYVALWTPEQWKGVVPKHVTQAKFVRLFGNGADYIVRNYPDDCIDAIMIAEFWITLYHREKFGWIKRMKAANVRQ